MSGTEHSWDELAEMGDDQQPERAIINNNSRTLHRLVRDEQGDADTACHHDPGASQVIVLDSPLGRDADRCSLCFDDEG